MFDCKNHEKLHTVFDFILIHFSISYICTMSYKYLLLLCSFASLTFSACKKEEEPYDPDKSYFSVKQFVADQYELYKGQPYMFEKTTIVNGKKDSSLVGYDKVDWNTVFKIFCDADISDNKFFERYDFNQFDDNILEASVLTYTAKEPDLFVKKFTINYDNVSRKISMIYIETADNGRFHAKEQKLSYYVKDKIVIQESEKSFLSDPKEVVITYKFQ